MELNKSPQWDIKIIAVCAAVAAVLLNGGLRVFNIWLSPTGQVLNSFIFALWVTQIAIFILLILSFILSSTRGEELSQIWQTLYISAGVFLAAGLISIPFGNLISAPIQQRGYEAFLLENEFLIDAILDFESTNGRPLETLEELVPNQLNQPIASIIEDQIGDSQVPTLQISVQYQSLDPVSSGNVLYSYKPPTETDPWQLQVSIYLGSFQSTRFIYNPEEKYSNRYSNIGRWGLAQ